MRKSSLQAILWVQEDLARLSGVCSPCWEQNCCCCRGTSRDRKTLKWEKKRSPHTCLSSRKHIWRHYRWGRRRKITLINKETRKRRKRTVSCGTQSHENSLQQMLKSNFVLKTEKGLLSSHLIPNAAGSSGNMPPSLVVHWRNTCLQSLFRKGSKAISCLEQIPELGSLPSPRHSQLVASRLSSLW